MGIHISAAAFFARAALAERAALIEAEKATYPIGWMCAQLGVPRSSFYAWRNRTETPTQARRRELAVEVRRVFDALGDLGLPAGGRTVEPGGPRVLGGAGRGPDA